MAFTEYDKTVLSHQPKHFYPRIDGQRWPDVVRDADGRFVGGRGESVMPDGSEAPHFDGATQYAWMPDSSYFGPASARSAWTFTAWARPTVAIYPHDRSEGYVHWIGKKNDWLSRIYSANATRDGKPYRQGWLSCYVFDPDEQFGAGQSYQERLVVKQWYHVAFVVRLNTRKCGLFLDGKQIRGWASLEDDEGRVQFDVHPVDTTARLIVGRDSALDPDDGKPRSWFRGAVGKPAFFTYDLSAHGVSEQYPAGRITQQALAGKN